MTDGTQRPSEIAIRVSGLRKTFRRRRHEVVAIERVSFDVTRGTTLGIVGESGSGKSTLARCLIGLLGSDEGEIDVLGHRISGASFNDLRRWRRDMQIVFQEPYESLDPRLRVGKAIAEPLLLHTGLGASEREERVTELLALVRLDPGLRTRYPHELSGGQQQRVNIARALATNPKVLILDEPTSALDVSVRAGVLELLATLQGELALTYVVISHDFETIRAISDRVAVMYLGRLVELGPTPAVLTNPEHPYTRELLGAELSLDAIIDRIPPVAPAAPPSVEVAPGGCVFLPRCPDRVAACTQEEPPLRPTADGHLAACVHAGRDRTAPQGLRPLPGRRPRALRRASVPPAPT